MHVGRHEARRLVELLGQRTQRARAEALGILVLLGDRRQGPAAHPAAVFGELSGERRGQGVDEAAGAVGWRFTLRTSRDLGAED
jgi:hypothetical protein